MAQQHENPRRNAALAALAEAEAAARSVAEHLAGRPVAQGITIDGPLPWI